MNTNDKPGSIIDRLTQRLQKTKAFDFIQKNKVALSLAIFGIVLLGFLFLTAFVIVVPPHFIDLRFSEEIQEKNNGCLDVFMKGISWFGNIRVSITLVVSSSVAFWLFRYRKEALFMLCTLLSGVISWVLKTLIDRPRPAKDLVSILEDTHYQSFPSGHVLFYTVFFGTLTIITTRCKTLNLSLKISGIVLCLGMIFFVGVSRVYLGAHWFTDVLGGFLAGIMYLFLAGYTYFRYSEKQTV